MAYTRECLLSLKSSPTPEDLYGDILNTPPELKRTKTQVKANLKKRESRGSIRERIIRQGCKYPLPTMILTNIRSLSNKINELMVKVECDRDYRQSNLICLTETWLKRDIPDPNLTGYTLIRAARDTQQS